VALSGSPPQSNGDQPAIVPLKPHNYRFILDSNGTHSAKSMNEK
jgi:hypothetical protein